MWTFTFISWCQSLSTWSSNFSFPSNLYSTRSREQMMSTAINSMYIGMFANTFLAKSRQCEPHVCWENIFILRFAMILTQHCASKSLRSENYANNCFLLLCHLIYNFILRWNYLRWSCILRNTIFRMTCTSSFLNIKPHWSSQRRYAS